MANKHIKRFSTSLISEKCKCISEKCKTMRYWLLSKSVQTINAGEGVEKKEPSYTVGGSAN